MLYIKLNLKIDNYVTRDWQSVGFLFYQKIASFSNFMKTNYENITNVTTLTKLLEINNLFQNLFLVLGLSRAGRLRFLGGRCGRFCLLLFSWALQLTNGPKHLVSKIHHNIWQSWTLTWKWKTKMKKIPRRQLLLLHRCPDRQNLNHHQQSQV